MPVFIAAILGGLMSVAGSIAGRVLIGLGISVVTYTGFSATFGWLKSQAVTALSGMSAETVQMLSYMKVGVAVSIIFSAITVRYTLAGLSSGTLKKWVLK